MMTTLKIMGWIALALYMVVAVAIQATAMKMARKNLQSFKRSLDVFGSLPDGVLLFIEDMLISVFSLLWIVSVPIIKLAGVL